MSIENASARFVASGMAGGLELCVFYPIDTIAKRMMVSQDSCKAANWQRILLQEGVNSSRAGKIKSLFPGLSFGAAYKVTQRAYVWGGQPYVREVLKRRYQVHEKMGKPFCDGLAGSIMGVGEVSLLPLNALKTRAQTNPQYRVQGLMQFVRQHGVMRLYAGWQWAVTRNIPGSFALFGATAFVRQHILGLANNKDASVTQNAIASTAGCVSSILVACPFDVVKTRIQSGAFGDRCGMHIARDIFREEGFNAFFKGAAPKLLTVGPKLIFSFTLAQCLMAKLEQ